MHRRPRSVLLCLCTWLLLVACAPAAPSESAASSAAPSPATAPGAASAPSSYPVTVTNCGTAVTIDQRPGRVLLVNADTVPLLAAVDALGTVVARTGTFDLDVYDDDTQAALEAVPELDADKNATGGAVISQEVILDQQPDLVLAPENAVDRDALAAAGVAVYSPPAYCETDASTGDAAFDWVYGQVEEYGQIFDAQDLADDVVDGLSEDVEELESADAAGDLTSAALYVPEGGGTSYPYGAPSMLTPIMSAAGFDNVYADADERVFEANIEDLLERDPDVLVLLYSSGDGQDVVDLVRAIPGLDALTALREDQLVVLKFPYTDPPTPLSVQGAQQLAEWATTLQ